MCGLAAASVGVTINTAGVFYAPIAESLGVGRGSAAMAVTVTSIIASVIGMGIPKLISESNLKIMIIAATVMLAGSTVLISMSSSLWMIYLLSVVRGIGDGMINFVLVTMIINYWFYAKRGLFTSIVMSTSGIPGVILSPVFSDIINRSGWRTAFIWVAACTLICCLPAILLPLTIRPETAGIRPYGYEEFMRAKEAGRTNAIESATSRFNFFSVKFLLAVVIVSCASIVAAVPSHLPGYAVSIGKAASVGALMLSVSMAFNIISKLCFGVMNDRIGPSRSIIFMASLNIAGILMLLFIPQEIVMYLGSGLLACVFSIGAVGNAMLAGYLFGMENYASAYPVLSFIGGLSNAAAATMVGSLYDITGSYAVNFWMALGLQILLIICVAATTSIRRKERHSGIETAA